jgi:hypothetical protein
MEENKEIKRREGRNKREKQKSEDTKEVNRRV